MSVMMYIHYGAHMSVMVHMYYGAHIVSLCTCIMGDTRVSLVHMYYGGTRESWRTCGIRGQLEGISPVCPMWVIRLDRSSLLAEPPG